jgi:hypothetical protein
MRISKFSLHLSLHSARSDYFSLALREFYSTTGLVLIKGFM